MSKKIKYKGKSIEDAIARACKALNLTSDELNIEVVSAGSAGIFGLCKKQAVISVTKKDNETGKLVSEPLKVAEPAPEPEPESADKPPATEKTTEHTPPRSKTVETASIPDTEPKPGKDKKSSAAKKKKESAGRKTGQKPVYPKQLPVEPSEEMINEIKTVLNRLLGLMNFSADLEITSEPGKVNIEVTSDFSELLVADAGRPLDGMQYIIRKIIGKKFPEKIIIFLDSGGFRAKRKKELEETALKLAEEVKTGGKNRTITSLNPAERRIVHMALQEDKAIRSRSIGDGLFKKILIYPPGKGRKKPSRGRKRK